MSTPPDLRARVLAAARTPSPPRRAAARGRRSALIGAAVITVLFTAALGFRPGARPPAFVALLAAGFLVIAGLGASAIARRRSMLGPPRSVLVTVAAAVPVALAAWLGLLYAAFPGTSDLETHARAHAICFGATVVLAVAPLAAALRARGQDPVHPGATAAALAACAAAVAAAAMLLHCPFAGSTHMLVGHLAPAAAVVGLGALALGRLLRLR